MDTTRDGYTARDRWRTSISLAVPDALLLRGYPLAEVMRELSFSEGVFLTVRGRLPDERERELFDTILCSLLDHQFVSASVPAARYAASGNPDVVAAAAAGILSAGRNTLSPQDAADLLLEAREIQEQEGLDVTTTAQRIVAAWRDRGRRIPGLGHPLYKEADPRATCLLQKATDLDMAGPAVEMIQAVHRVFLEQIGKQVALNIDGMLSAVMTDMGFTPRQMVAVNILSYMPGILAHVIEEIEDGVPLRTIPDPLADYEGEPLRHLDARGS